MISTRRSFIKRASVGASAALIMPRMEYVKNSSLLPDGSYSEDPHLAQLVQMAIDAAMDGGASYADASLTHVYDLGVTATTPLPDLKEDMSFGVRALYDGYWGFAASPTWTTSEAGRLGKAALTQARINAFDKARDIDLAPIGNISNGHWSMPIKDDPFKISPDEIYDYLKGISVFVGLLPFTADGADVRAAFRRREKCFGSSLGQNITQTLYSTTGLVQFSVSPGPRQGVESVVLDTLTPAGMGFEYFRDQDLRAQIVLARDEKLEDMRLPLEPLDVGRYDILMHDAIVASLISKTIGLASQADRVMGFEANASGTSYITEPEQMLGQLKIGNSKLNVSADRSAPGSVNRVRWDDEGVLPVKFDIVKYGVLQNLQYNREAAGWLKSDRTSANSHQSFGCATTPSSLDVPMIFNADLSLKAADNTSNLKSMRETMESGLEMQLGGIAMDFQQITGFGSGRFFRVKNGKKIAKTSAAAMLFRTPELWSNLVDVSGSLSVRRFGLADRKGEPAQEAHHSVFTPTALFKDVTIIDPTKKA